jgi:hypothetical protein
MRIIHSGGKVNIYNLAKNAGTSVDQIERFYARKSIASGSIDKSKLFDDLQRADARRVSEIAR